jgi:hypothetical protein
MEGTSKAYHLKSHVPSLDTGQEKTWDINFWETLIFLYGNSIIALLNNANTLVAFPFQG